MFIELVEIGKVRSALFFPLSLLLNHSTLDNILSILHYFCYILVFK